jgi:NO-binding membrane sensor protein with MHYT domain
LIDREAIMSKLTRTLIIGAMLAAMHLAGMTAVA